MAEGRSEYPGYYPGSPIQRQPRPYSRGRPPMEFTPGMADHYFESLKEAGETYFKVPYWMWQQEVGNIQGSFMRQNAPDFGGRISTEAYQAFGQEELEELPGAQGAAIDYNPVNWISNPGEQVKKHLQKHWNSITDFQDFRQGMQRELWTKATTIDKRSPYYIDDDTYSKVRTEMPRFMSNSASAFARNDTFKDFNMAVLSGLSEELMSQDSTGNKKYDRFDAKDKSVIDQFNSQVAIAKSMDQMSDSIDNMNKSFDEGFFSTSVAKDKDAMSNNIERFNDSISNAERAIAKAKANGAYDKKVKAYEAYINDLKATINGKYSRNAAIGKWELNDGVEKSLHSSLKTKKDVLFRKTIDGGLGGSYVRQLTNQQVRNGKSALNNTLAAKDSSGYITSDTSRNLSVITGTATRTFEWRASWDLIQDIEKGRLPTQFIYNRILLPRIERYTPSYHLKRWFFKEFKDAEGNTRFRNPVVDFFEGGRKKYKFNMYVAGTGTVTFHGGKHFDLSGGLMSKMLRGGSGGMSPDIIKLLNNDMGTLAALGIKGGDAGQLRKTRAFLIRNAKLLGLELDGSGIKLASTDKNNKALTSIFTDIRRRKLDPSEFDPSIARTSIHGRYARALSKFQNSVFAKAYKYTYKTWDVLAEKLIDWGGRVLEKAFGAWTGGLGYAVAWVARIALVYVVQKTVKRIALTFEAIKKQDMRFFENAAQEIYNFLAKTVAALGIGCGMVFLPVLFVMQIIISSFTYTDTTKTGGSYIDENVVALPPTSYYGDASCGGNCGFPNICTSKGYYYYICITPEDLPGGGQEQY